MVDGARPNVLFVITDQQRADHLGFAGNDVVRTPNLDALAERGTVFDNAWVANPVCMPNRASIVTGRLPSAHGVIFNDRSLEWGANTFVRSFRDAGWRTALIGKSHFQHGSSRNSRIPVERRPATTDCWPEGWDTLEDEERYADEPPPWPDDFYGFGHVELTLEHGARVGGHHLHWALSHGGRHEDLVVPYSAESPAEVRSDRWWQIYRPPYGPELHSTTFVADRTVAFIESAVQAGEPWLAWASFPDPHHPITPPGEWWARHDPADMELPATIDDPMEHGLAHLRRVQHIAAGGQLSWVTPFGASDHELVREAIAGTYGTIEMIDAAVGTVLDAIDRLGQTEDTIVVFTSDHGDMMGDHGLMMKAYMPYRGTLQVPYVIATPGRSARRSRALVSSLDLAPTLLELAGLGGHVGMQGQSLVPVLDDPSASVRDALLIEDDAPRLLSRFTGYPEKTRTVVGADGTKFTRLSTREDLLFDLGEDPDEMAPHTGDGTRRAAALEMLSDVMLDAADAARGQAVTPPA
jgi:arylsulfatase A-like enzyme